MAWERSEFVFELLTCRWAERAWPPGGSLPNERGVLVSRQLGTKRRRWDTIVIEVDREAFGQRERFGEKRLTSDLLHVVRNAPETWSWYRDALPEPEYPWRYVREAVHEAADRGILETRRRGNRIEIRRKWAYPDWVRSIAAIENKPDLDASAARALAAQVERDVALALADEVWVATSRTGDRVEPALFESLPVEVGILTMDFEEAEPARVEWHPRRLAVDRPGTKIGERPPASEYDRSATPFEYVSATEKADRRLEIAERAYERGWRRYRETMRPDCRHFELREESDTYLPWCAAKGRHPSARECSGSCPEFSPEPPAWRTKGWPIEGGPGSGLRDLLDRRRERYRP